METGASSPQFLTQHAPQLPVEISRLPVTTLVRSAQRESWHYFALTRSLNSVPVNVYNANVYAK